MSAGTASLRIKKIHASVQKVRTSEKIGVKYMQLWEEKALEREMGKAEGQAEGDARRLVKSVEEVMKHFGVELRQACEGVGTTAEEYQKAKKCVHDAGRI